jgi:ABC-type nickel/cobalt efflux system permease component RcnA
VDVIVIMASAFCLAFVISNSSWKLHSKSKYKSVLSYKILLCVGVLYLFSWFPVKEMENENIRKCKENEI